MINRVYVFLQLKTVVALPLAEGKDVSFPEPKEMEDILESLGCDTRDYTFVGSIDNTTPKSIQELSDKLASTAAYLINYATEGGTPNELLIDKREPI